MDINGAGVSASDPIMEGLRVSLVFGDAGMGISNIDEVYLDTDQAFPGTNSIKNLLSPASDKYNAGTCDYNNTSNLLENIDTSDLTDGDVLYLSHPNITAGLYRTLYIADGTNLALDSDPFFGLGHAFGVQFQFAWRYTETLGSGLAVSSPAGQENWLKLSAQNINAQSVIASDSFFVREAPTGAQLLSLNGGDHTGQETNNPSISIQIVPAWASKGGVTHVSFANHSVAGRNDFNWITGYGVLDDVPVADAESSGILASSGDGMKYGALSYKTGYGGDNVFLVDFSIDYDTTGPSVTISAIGS